MHPGTAVQSDDGGIRACAIGLGQIALNAVAPNEPARNKPLRGAFKLYALQRCGPCISHRRTYDAPEHQYQRGLESDCSRQWRLSSDLRPKSSCGCEAFQSPRPRRFSHDVAQVSIPIQHAGASAWTALRSSRSIVVLLMLFQPEHDVSSWQISELRTSPTNVRSSNGSRHRAC